MNNKVLIKPEKTIRQAMKQLGKIGERCLVVINESGELLGTLSDGDLRKAILNNSRFSESIDTIYQKNPKVLNDKTFTYEEAKRLFLENRYDLIPIVDFRSKIKDILFIESVLDIKEKNKKLDIPVVIMAGGKGTRMEPFTKVLPKPLIPVHDRPIIEHIIDRFTNFGCNQFHLSVNYKSRILKAYFDELEPLYTIQYIEEDTPMGTAGSLSFLKEKFKSPFFVTNCDIIVKANYESLYKFHKDGKYDISLVACAKEYIIPYGTCNLNEKGHLLKIDEKPQYDFLINTGLYIINPEVINLIPKNKFYHITNLIEDAMKEGKKVGVFPIDEDRWIDVGQWTEYKSALNKL